MRFLYFLHNDKLKFNSSQPCAFYYLYLYFYSLKNLKYFMILFSALFGSLTVWKDARPCTEICFFARKSKVLFALVNLDFALWDFWKSQRASKSQRAKYQNPKMCTKMDNKIFVTTSVFMTLISRFFCCYKKILL